MKKGVWIVGVIIIAIVVAIFVSFNAESSDTIKVGGLFALTGKWTTGGETEANFAKMAIDEINANGGVNGKMLAFILEDDKCSGEASISGAMKLMGQDDVKVILGPSCTPASAPVAPLANENQVFMLAATTTAVGVFDEYDYAFRMSPPATDAAKIIGDVAVDKYELKKVAIITEQTEFAESWANEFGKSFISNGGEIILTEKYVTGTTDFKSVITKIKAEDVDSVFISGQTPEDVAIVIKQMKELGLLDEVQIIGNPAAIDSSTYDASDKILPENAFTVVIHSENEELHSKYLDKYGKELGFQFFYTAAMYDAVYMLKDALEECGEDSTCIRDYFERDIVDWEGNVATWDFDSNGDPLISKDAFREIRIVDGEKVYENI
jgi:branched-chain amino acid transport system substrate-binding protein